MKKLIFILFGLLLYLGSFQAKAQDNWLCVYPDRKVYFEDMHKMVYAIRIDATSDDNNKTLYPFSDLHQIDWDCYSITSGSWISKYIILDDDGNTFFVNGNNQQIFIKSQADLNETWDVFENDQIKVKGKIASIEEKNVLGVQDLVKTISFSVYDLNDTPINHSLNQISIEVCENFGLVKTISFYYFEHPNNNWISIDFLEPFTLIGIDEPQLGFQNINLREQYFDFQPGDELHILFLDNQWGYRGIARESILRYLARADFADRIEYTVERKNRNQTWSFPNGVREEDISITTNIVTQTIQKEPLFTTEPNEPFAPDGWGLYKVMIHNTQPATMYFQELYLSLYEQSCYTEYLFDGCDTSGYYIQGLGGPYYGYCQMFGTLVQNTLVYYKKGDIESGTPFDFEMSVPKLEIDTSFAIYPNPASDYITIKSANNESLENSIIEIYDIYGRKCLSKPLDSSGFVDVSFLSSGYYIVKLIKENETLLHTKMIKN